MTRARPFQQVDVFTPVPLRGNPLAVVLDGQTTVMVTHDPRAAAAADRVLFLADGRVVADLENPTEELILDALKAAS